MLRAVVIRAAGTNCDAEMVRAFSLVGCRTDLLHLDRLIADPPRLDAYDLIGFPGGFSYGDDIASGRIYAMKVRERLYPALRAAVLRGRAMIGACNGFQVLVQVGLLPGPPQGEPWPADRPPPQSTALSDNAGARFADRWIGVRAEPGSVCCWTRGLGEDAGGRFELPVAHGEGRFVTDSPEGLASLERSGRVALRYTDNFNGSQGAVAGICDASGRILGLMPHPERFLEWSRHPLFTRLDARARAGETPGLRMFRNAVEAVCGAGAAR